MRFGRITEAIVLVLLAQGRSYGYEIRRRLDEFGYERSDSDAGALYRLLRDLEAGGFIASEWDVEGTGPARRYYGLTEAGHARLKREAERMGILAQRIERFFSAYRTLEASLPDREPATNR